MFIIVKVDKLILYKKFSDVREFFTTYRGVYNFVGPPPPPIPSLGPIELLPIEP